MVSKDSAIKKPEMGAEYKNWLKKEHSIITLHPLKTHYEVVGDKIKRDLEQSTLWKDLLKSLPDYNEEYRVKHDYELLLPGFSPNIVIKPFQSFLRKTHRKNIKENKNWPRVPQSGWVLPHNWFSQINDIVRTLIIVKYLDGVTFLVNKIDSLCKQSQLGFEASLEARPEGYYAAHLYTRMNFEIPKVSWETERVDVFFEIQVTTQLQENIRNLLHKYYKERRNRLTSEAEKWEWDYKSDEFAANYLGHILHYLEGMIVEIRGRRK
ncbi:MAG TPA: hypothetical protein VMW42_12625 [Desulfatiglandales bacterium]|nr:hypothetical protein [Desulfatiglandales bacterium]